MQDSALKSMTYLPTTNPVSTKFSANYRRYSYNKTNQLVHKHILPSTSTRTHKAKHLSTKPPHNLQYPTKPSHKLQYPTKHKLKLSFPKFKGEDLHGWIYKCEQYFEFKGIIPLQLVQLASFHLEEIAL